MRRSERVGTTFSALSRGFLFLAVILVFLGASIGPMRAPMYVGLETGALVVLSVVVRTIRVGRWWP